jgi:uncharacterized protein
MSSAQTVAILGASADPERYAHMAQVLLKQNGHRVIPVNARLADIDGDATVASLGDIRDRIDTLTLYVRPAVSSENRAAIESLKPKRVIFNPGTENPQLAAELNKAGIETEDACTLVLLRTHQF